MVKIRAKKIENIVDDIPEAEVLGNQKGNLLVVSWGGTFGSVHTAVDKKQKESKSVSHLHLRYLNPLPKNVGEILSNFKQILVPEINLGQLIKILREKYLVNAVGFNFVRGLPLRSAEIEAKIDELIERN